MTFIDLRDRYGITQLVLEADADAALVETATSLGREYVIQATGEVVERQSRNARMDTGDIEIKLEAINILNKSVTPPFTIEDESDGGEDLRAKFRYLDTESGVSLRASGWRCAGLAGGREWTGRRRPPEPLYPAQMKYRYEKNLSPKGDL